MPAIALTSPSTTPEGPAGLSTVLWNLHVAAQKPCLVWLVGPNSILALSLEPEGNIP